MAVISGVGARGYYRKLGYELRGEGAYSIKELPFFSPGWREACAAPARALAHGAATVGLPVLALLGALLWGGLP